MLTKEQVLTAIKNGERKSQCLDYRDFERLTDYFEYTQWEIFFPGYQIQPKDKEWKPLEWSVEKIFERMKKDLLLGIKEAHKKNGICWQMYHVVKMWLWILEDDYLQNLECNNSYALPFFYEVAGKFGIEFPPME